MSITENLDKINCLHDQIEALLDLIQCCNEECVDVRSLQVSAEMANTMLDEIMIELKNIEGKCKQ